ncbi:twin-arginine translocase TatA/TatE family subunit [Nocardioides insulae]|uniref:twin-arginine translocase TatA/TatE family subunit n=1 Tax=Nocardioides insulae TaxID=394734 RepID=UPI0004144CC9|nr:twin-arginine translocase TatA/TatE family subunit [Nocardioides insulae]
MFGLGTQELVLILLVLILLFGATKLPELARGGGRALRIFKSETKGLLDDDEDEKKTSTSASDPGELPTKRSEPVDAEIVEDTPQHHGRSDNA